MSYDLEYLHEAIWKPPFDIIAERPVEYHKRLRNKYQDLCQGIKYLQLRIADPEITESVKESAIRLLKGYQRTRRIYEIQASILAA